MPTFNVTVTPTKDAAMSRAFKGRASKTISVGPVDDEKQAEAAALAAMKITKQQCEKIEVVKEQHGPAH